MKENYERPQLKKVEIRNKEAVADTCWGLSADHPNQVERFYDIKGDGIVGFNVKNASGNCGGPDAYNILYYAPTVQGEEPKGVDLYKAFDSTTASAIETELEVALSSKGGNNGQPYKGIDTDFPIKPVPDIS